MGAADVAFARSSGGGVAGKGRNQALAPQGGVGGGLNHRAGSWCTIVHECRWHGIRAKRG
jgi:hypothetical protein